MVNSLNYFLFLLKAKMFIILDTQLPYFDIISEQKYYIRGGMAFLI